MSDRDEIIAQFVEVSGVDEDIAKFYLSGSNWDLEEAVCNFLGQQNDSNEGASSAEMPEADVTAGASTESSTAKPTEEFAKTSKGKPKFATLNDMSKGGEDDEEEGQAFYAGGSERSGQQVLGPPKRKNFREQLTEMFRMAHDHSPESIDTHLAPSTSSGANNNWGQGVRLGMTDSDHSVVASGTNRANRDGAAKKPIVVLKLWSQGFSVDGGELRNYDDPQNKEFLETVMRGEIPTELLEMGWMVNVDVEDHRHEDYKKGPTKKTFRGSGHTLGSPTPNVEVSTVPSSSAPIEKKPNQSSDDSSAAEKLANDKLNINNSAPTTTLQIRLSDGSRIAAQFNMTHTVADIQQFIRIARPQYAEQNFILVSSFPTRELNDGDATIESAGLKNASLMQRLK